MGAGQFRKKKHHVFLAKLTSRKRAGLAIDDKMSLASHTQFIRNSDRSLCALADAAQLCRDWVGCDQPVEVTSHATCP